MNKVTADILAIQIAVKAIDADFESLTKASGKYAAKEIAAFIKTLSQEFQENIDNRVTGCIIDKP